MKKQRFCSHYSDCDTGTFIINHEKKGWLRETKEKIIEMALNGSGIRDTARVLAYVLGRHQDSVMLKLKELFEPFGVRHFFTDGWGGYERHIASDQLSIGKEKTKKIERKHLTLRTRIKRLARKTICFSKSEIMHDIVIGMFINRYEFGLAL